MNPRPDGERDPADLAAARSEPARGVHVVGVGGVVLREGRALLVRLTYSDFRGRYMLPGGVLKRGETLGQAIVREVREETGVDAEVDGAIAVRCRLDVDSTNVYVVFQMRHVSGEPRPDGRENDDARFFARDELGATDPHDGPIVPYARHLCLKALSGDVRILRIDDYEPARFSPRVLGWEGFA